MTQTLEERAKAVVEDVLRVLGSSDFRREEMHLPALEHLRAVERAATKAAYERAAFLCVDESYARDETQSENWNSCVQGTCADLATKIRALADGGSDG